jgi:hypothetical protein
MLPSPFLVVRYAGGSCGRFLSSILQLSNSVACWDSKLELSKNSNSFHEEFLEYIGYSFPLNPKYHLLKEPDLPYYSDFYSGTYDRGSDITYEQYLHELGTHNDFYFKDNLIKNKKVNLILHKSRVPKFLNGSDFVNIIIDTEQSLEFSQALLWKKHYEILSSTEVLHLPDHPERCNPKRKSLVQQFFVGSPIIIGESIEEIYKNRIINNPEFNLFSSTESLYNDDSNKLVSNTEFFLGNIFDSDKFHDNIIHICEKLALELPNRNTVINAHKKWLDIQKEIIK